MAKNKNKHPFKQSQTEVEREQAEVEAKREAESAVGNASNDATPPVDRSATKSNHEMAREILENLGKPGSNEGPRSSIGPSDLIDQLESSKTGKSKIEAGRAYVTANSEATSEDMVKALGSNGWPPGTVAKATAILEANPAGDP